MSGRKNLYAWTVSGGAWPPYISINLVPDGVEIAVRAAPRDMGDTIECGDTATIKITRDEFERMRQALMDNPCARAA